MRGQDWPFCSAMMSQLERAGEWVSRLDDLVVELQQVELASAPSVAELRSRIRTRSRRRRGVALGVAGVVAGAVGLISAHGDGSPTPTLSSQVTAFVSSGPPHLLNHAINFSYLPSGFRLLSDRQTSVVTEPASYSRSITYGGQVGTERASFTFTLTQGILNPDFTSPPPGGIANAKLSVRAVNGQTALMEVLSSAPVVTKGVGFVDGRRTTTIDVVCPGSSASTYCKGDRTSQVGPPGLFNSTGSTVTPQIVLQWRMSPTVGLQLDGSGISASRLIDIADGIRIDMARQSCISDGKALEGGLCSPGIHASPPINTPMVPLGGTELAYGTVSGSPWVFSAAVEPGNAWMEIVYADQVVTASGSNLARASLNWDNAPNGQEFVSGMVPSWVTSVSVKLARKSETSLVLPSSISGWHFFVLPMGKTTSSCNGVCNDPISVLFYKGSTVVGKADMSTTETSWGGIPLKESGA